MTSRNAIIITSADGHVGRSTIAELAAHRPKTYQVVAGVHSAANKEQIQDLGCDSVISLNADNLDQLGQPFQSAHCVFIIPPTDQDKLHHGMNYIKAASKAEVPLVVLLSVVDAPHRTDMYAKEFLSMEAELVRLCSKDFVIIRTGFFQENLLLLSDVVRDNNVLPLPIGDGNFAPVSYIDIGRVAGRILAKPNNYRGKTIDILGGEVLNGPMLAERMSKILNKQISFKGADPEEFKRMLMGKGMTEHEAESVKQMCKVVSEGKLNLETPHFKEILGEEARSIDAFFMKNAAAFGGARREE